MGTVCEPLVHKHTTCGRKWWKWPNFNNLYLRGNGPTGTFGTVSESPGCGESENILIWSVLPTRLIISQVEGWVILEIPGKHRKIDFPSKARNSAYDNFFEKSRNRSTKKYFWFSAFWHIETVVNAPIDIFYRYIDFWSLILFFTIFTHKWCVCARKAPKRPPKGNLKVQT